MRIIHWLIRQHWRILLLFAQHGLTVSQMELPFCTLATAVKLICVAADTASVCARGVAPFTELNDKKVGTNVSGPLIPPPPFTTSTTGTTIGLFETPDWVTVTEPEYTPAALPAARWCAEALAGS